MNFTVLHINVIYKNICHNITFVNAYNKTCDITFVNDMKLYKIYTCKILSDCKFYLLL